MGPEATYWFWRHAIIPFFHCYCSCNGCWASRWLWGINICYCTDLSMCGMLFTLFFIFNPGPFLFVSRAKITTSATETCAVLLLYLPFSSLGGQICNPYRVWVVLRHDTIGTIGWTYFLVFHIVKSAFNLPSMLACLTDFLQIFLTLPRNVIVVDDENEMSSLILKFKELGS